MRRSGSYIFIIEDKYYSSQEILNLLNNNRIHYELLLLHNCIKYNDSNYAAFGFVGVITINDIIICVFPKYYNSTDEQFCLEQFVKIIKVLKKAGAVDDITPDFKNFSPKHISLASELVLADNLIKDYLDYGLFRKEQELFLLNESGEINWSKTIETIDPFFTKGRPIYSDTFVNYQSNDLYNSISLLHAWVLKLYLKKYGKLLDYSFSFNEDTPKYIEEIGSFSYLESLLRKELSQAFVDRRIRLLRLLLAVLDNTYIRESKGLYIYGTRYFYTIWEKVCGSAFRDQKSNFSAVIPKPKWHDLHHQSTTSDTLRPDIIYKFESESPALFVLDAKYYNFKFLSGASFDVKNIPGLGDISKQFLYEKAVEILDYNIINMLLFPKLQKMPVDICGLITFDIFPKKKVWLCYVNANEVFDLYLLGRSLDLDIFVSIQQRIDALA